jgi:hypothetical protein
MVVTSRVQQNREWHFEFIKQFEQSPGADPVTIFTPPPIIRIGMIEARRVRQTEARPIREMFDAKRDIDRQFLVARPGEVRSAADTLIGKARVPLEIHLSLRGELD